MGAEDDYRCDLCGTVKKQRDMTLCSPELFKEAVRAGLRPDQSVSIGLVSAQEFEADWVTRALTDDTGWGLCQRCAFRVEGYLEDDGTWSKREPQSGA
jgi:hypothetical protein